MLSAIFENRKKVAELIDSAKLTTFDGHSIYLIESDNEILVPEALARLAALKQTDFVVNLEHKNNFFNYTLRTCGDFDVADFAESYGGGGNERVAFFKLRRNLIG